MIEQPNQNIRDVVQMVMVTNRNAFAISDYFDGVPFTFKTNEKLAVPAEVATHIFGWPGEPEDMFRHTSKRMGWNSFEHMKPGDDGRSVAQRYFDNLKFEQQVYDLVPRTIGGNAPIPADPGPEEQFDEDTRARQASNPVNEPGGAHVGRRATGGAPRPRRTPRRVDEQV